MLCCSCSPGPSSRCMGDACMRSKPSVRTCHGPKPWTLRWCEGSGTATLLRTLPAALGGQSLSPSWGAAWRTDGGVGAPGAAQGATLRSKFLLGCRAQLGQGLGRLCSGTRFLLCGRRKKRITKGGGPPCGHVGLLWAQRPIPLPGWGWRPMWARKPLWPSQRKLSPTCPLWWLLSELSASAVRGVARPSCYRAPASPSGLSAMFIPSQTD